MRYLKPFNESTDDNFAEDLKEFCELNLAYLLDDGEVIVDTEGKTTLVKISITNSVFFLGAPWSNIKDHMIPFLIRLLKNYHIEERSFGIDKDGVLLNAAILDLENPLQFKKVPFTVEDLIKDNNPYSVKTRTVFPTQVHLEDLVISYFQFFVKK